MALFPILQNHTSSPPLREPPTPNLLWRIWILGKSSHYSSWKKETHSIYNICLCHTKRADTRCIDDKVAILWSYKKVHRKTHLNGKHPLGSLGTLKERHGSLFWTPWHFGTSDIPALADYLWISWSTKNKNKSQFGKATIKCYKHNIATNST